MNFHENDLVSLYLSELYEVENIKNNKQSIQLYIHPTLGKVLIINGEIQHIENYQCIYHEMLVHLPVSFIPSPKRALIIGGGSLFAAYELLKYSSIIQLDLCDHDSYVISSMEKYYSHAKSVVSDNRFHYINEDARKYLGSSVCKYDIIVNDCFNVIKEVMPSGMLLSDLLLGMLTKDGVCADIIYRHIFDKETTISTLNKMTTYSNVCFSLVTVPEYPGILHIEVLWGNNSNLRQDAKQGYNHEQQKQTFQYYNPYMLPYYLYLPPYIKSFFKE